MPGGKCTQYYGATVQEVDSVVISNTTPLCGKANPVTDQTCYLELINMHNFNKSGHYCYDIKSISATSLAIHQFDSNGDFVFKKME
jgi:hypothetical protein